MGSDTAGLARHGSVARMVRRDLPAGVDPRSVDAGTRGGR